MPRLVASTLLSLNSEKSLKISHLFLKLRMNVCSMLF